jgi:hypothetical protein
MVRVNYDEASAVFTEALRATRERERWANDNLEYQRDRDAWKARLHTLAEADGEAQRAVYAMLYALTEAKVSA